MQRNPNPRTSLRRLSELRSLALGAALGAILADPMATIHGWAELLDLLVFWRQRQHTIGTLSVNRVWARFTASCSPSWLLD